MEQSIQSFMNMLCELKISRVSTINYLIDLLCVHYQIAHFFYNLHIDILKICKCIFWCSNLMLNRKSSLYGECPK